MSRCSHYIKQPASPINPPGNSKRCEAEAVVWLLDPDGKDVPGCCMCQEHAQACIDEYREKLHEEWSTRPLTEYEGY